MNYALCRTYYARATFRNCSKSDMSRPMPSGAAPYSSTGD